MLAKFLSRFKRKRFNSINDANKRVILIPNTRIPRLTGPDGQILQAADVTDRSPDRSPEIQTQHNSKENQKFINTSNAISTTKYKWYNFIFKNFWEQISTRYANIYFILVAGLNFIPWAEVLGPAILTLPVVVIMTFTLLKDGYEDFFRYKNDNKTNQQLTEIFNHGNGSNGQGNGSNGHGNGSNGHGNASKGMFEDIQWQYLKPGDLILIKNGEVVPADCLVISTTEDKHSCYLKTSNLDGESNLKMRQAINVLNETDRLPGNICSKIDYLTVKYPNPKFESTLGQVHFRGPSNGTGSNGSGSRTIDFSEKDNMLLRGTILANTDYASCLVIFTGKHTKTRLNTKPNKRKTSKLEAAINKLIPFNFLFMVILGVFVSVGSYLRFKSLEENNEKDRENGMGNHDISLWYQNIDDDSLGVIAVKNLLIFFLSISTLVPIAIYVTWEIVKILQVHFIQNDKDLYRAVLGSYR